MYHTTGTGIIRNDVSSYSISHRPFLVARFGRNIQAFPGPMHVTEPRRLCLDTHIIVPRYSTLTSCLHVSYLSAVVLGRSCLGCSQIESHAAGDRSSFICPNHQHGAITSQTGSASDEIAVSVPRPRCFLSTRTHPTRTRRKERVGAWGRLFPGFYGHSSRRTRRSNSANTFYLL